MVDVRADAGQALDLANLKSLCPSCHSAETARRMRMHGEEMQPHAHHMHSTAAGGGGILL